MPAVLLPEERRTNINHAAHQLINLISRAASEAEENDRMASAHVARANVTSMQRTSTGLWNSHSVDAAGILASQQRRQIQILCAAMASVSIFAAMCAIYWFCMMRRNYRRDLVLMLILGDFYKSLWYLIHGSVNFARSQVTSDESFCQVSGFMLQMGLQACDVAILFISMHMALQIFPPKNSFLGHDGLYKVRHWVLAIWILLPCFTAALAFANPHGAYQAQGAFCWLPIRPFWYRLALSWIPRYLIWLYIMWVAIRIYSHVGYEFRVFGQEQDRSSSDDLSSASSVERSAIKKAIKEHRSHIMSNEKNDIETVTPEDWSIPRPMPSRVSPSESAQDSPANAGRRASLPTWHSPFGGPSSPTPPSADIFAHPTSRSNPASRRGSHQIAPGIMAEDFMAPPGFEFTNPRGSVSTTNSNHPSTTTNTVSPDYILPPIAETRGNSVSAQSSVHTSLGDRAQRQRRRAIQRQLRILFIYPIVYMLMWLIPFVSHCMSYSDRFAQHPIFPISLLSSFCQCFMGFADVSVFCWRERPWRHIPGSDGSFIGSFAFWRNLRAESADTVEWSRRESKAPRHVPGLVVSNHDGNNTGTGSETPTLSSSQAGLLASLRRWSMSRKNSTFSTAGSTLTAATAGGGGARRPAASKRNYTGGRQTKEAELAHERLKLEREDYERRNRASLDGAVSPGRTPGARREWFDLNVSEDTLELGTGGDGDGAASRSKNVTGTESGTGGRS